MANKRQIENLEFVLVVSGHVLIDWTHSDQAKIYVPILDEH